MRVVVLAGSGLSIGAGYPSTGNLTETVMSGQGVFRHTDGLYHLGSGPAADARVLEFLRRLAELVTKYYATPGRPLNYEDLAYVAGQLADSLSGDYDNPALSPLHDALRTEFGEGQDALGLATDALHYIADVTWRSLQTRRDANYLGSFVEFIQDDRIEDVSVFTLNHDTLLERTFRSSGVEFEDGFGDPVRGVRYWEPKRFEESRRSRRLVKLHGSVDWFLLRPDGGEFHEERIAQVSGDPEHTRDVNDRLQSPGDGRPLLLVGTHNKARGYLNPPYFDAHIEFYRRLNQEGVEVLLVIGYGGQDKAINERIVDWMEADRSHRLIFVNRSARVTEQARGALRGHVLLKTRFVEIPPKGIPRWREQGRFELIESAFEKVSTVDYLKSVAPRGRAS